MTPLDMSVIVFGIFAILFGIAALLMLVAWLKIHSSVASHASQHGPWEVRGKGKPLRAKRATETQS